MNFCKCDMQYVKHIANFTKVPFCRENGCKGTDFGRKISENAFFL